MIPELCLRALSNVAVIAVVFYDRLYDYEACPPAGWMP